MQQTETTLERAQGTLIFVKSGKQGEFGIFSMDDGRSAFVHVDSFPPETPFVRGTVCSFDLVPQSGNDKNDKPKNPRAINITVLGK